MIGDLLKQLTTALPKYFWHKIRSIGRRKPSLSLRKENEIRPYEDLDDSIGLDASYEALVPWKAYRSDILPQGIQTDELYQLWASTDGGQKWSHYFAIYQSVFEPLRARRLRILEIGVLQGSSLSMWRKYFIHPDTQIVGIDIQETCSRYDMPHDGVHVRIGSQDDREFLEAVISEFGPFDLIIDDGSHKSSHIIASFNILFGPGLKDSGIYFVEDLHANYWPSWRDSKKSFLDVCKELLEHMHGHYQRGFAGAFLVSKPSAQPASPLNVPLITTMIREMRFFDSIVAIYKTKLENIPHLLYGN